MLKKSLQSVESFQRYSTSQSKKKVPTPPPRTPGLRRMRQFFVNNSGMPWPFSFWSFPVCRAEFCTSFDIWLVYFRWGVRELLADEKSHKNRCSGHNSHRAAAPLELKVCDMFTHTVFKFQPDRSIISRVIQSPRFGTLWKKFKNFKPSQLLNGYMVSGQIQRVWVSSWGLDSLKFWANSVMREKSYSKDPASELVEKSRFFTK